jgi:hypothetical protein
MPKKAVFMGKGVLLVYAIGALIDNRAHGLPNSEFRLKICASYMFDACILWQSIQQLIFYHQSHHCPRYFG